MNHSVHPPSLNANKQFQDASPVDYDSRAEIEASEYQVLWSKTMNKGKYVRPSGYTKVEALLLCWAQGSGDMDTRREVNELSAVLMEGFGYNTTIEELDANMPTKLQVQLNAKVARFVDSHDGPSTLIIVYYAGHGKPGQVFGDLELFPCTSPNDRSKAVQRKRNIIVWNKTEQLLLPAEADVLEIFDCCYAGTVGLTRGEERLFEYLAASVFNGKTAVPGDESFTSALIYALKYLLNQKEEGRFTTVELLKVIKDHAPHFPKDQNPHISDRLEHGRAGRIMLHPLRPLETRTPSRKMELDLAKEHTMTLYFDFGEKPSKSQLEILGTELIDILDRYAVVNRNKLPLHEIRWGGLRASATARALKRFQDSLRKRRASKKGERPIFETQLILESAQLPSAHDSDMLTPPATGYHTQDSGDITDLAASESADTSEDSEGRCKSRRKRQKCAETGENAL